MLHEYRDIISDIKVSNAHFAKIFEKHNDLDQQITNIEEGREHMEQLALEGLKKEKLKLKDEAYAMIMAYKQEQESK
ncbi:MAG TPA: DUF465 domain-containing protein [Sulfurospirillum arcachonense]|nr:DUF465 domain-containing protein [Sulfurospirillum arcachonense]HIP45469.1 DUF465 domain-containing protein [Sulfurospirillum arcachonense]